MQTLDSKTNDIKPNEQKINNSQQNNQPATENINPNEKLRTQFQNNQNTETTARIPDEQFDRECIIKYKKNKTEFLDKLAKVEVDAQHQQDSEDQTKNNGSEEEKVKPVSKFESFLSWLNPNPFRADASKMQRASSAFVTAGIIASIVFTIVTIAKKRAVATGKKAMHEQQEKNGCIGIQSEEKNVTPDADPGNVTPDTDPSDGDLTPEQAIQKAKLLYEYSKLLEQSAVVKVIAQQMEQ